jgi:hypothetical protein
LKRRLSHLLPSDSHLVGSPRGTREASSEVPALKLGYALRSEWLSAPASGYAAVLKNDQLSPSRTVKNLDEVFWVSDFEIASRVIGCFPLVPESPDHAIDDDVETKPSSINLPLRLRPLYRHVSGFPTTLQSRLCGFQVLEIDRPKPGRFLRGGCSLENPTDVKLATVRSRIEDREIWLREFVGNDRKRHLPCPLPQAFNAQRDALFLPKTLDHTTSVLRL